MKYINRLTKMENFMQAIEFEAVIKNGVLEIPESYKDFDNVKAKIVIMKEENIDNDNDLSKEEKLTKLEQFKLFIANNEEPVFDKNIDVDELTNTINEDNL